jgi:hypothetical protein
MMANILINLHQQANRAKQSLSSGRIDSRTAVLLEHHFHKGNPPLDNNEDNCSRSSIASSGVEHPPNKSSK